MRIYLTFLKIGVLLSLLISLSVRANYDAALDLAKDLDHDTQINLATEILRNVLDTSGHGSTKRASRFIKILERLSFAVSSLINPHAGAAKTPSKKEIHGPGMVRYGEKKTIDGSPALIMDKEYRYEDHTLYIHSDINLKMKPLDLEGDPSDDIMDFIGKNEINIKKLIKEYISFGTFYIGIVNAPDGSPQNLGRRCSQHVADLNKPFPTRRVENLEECLEEGGPIYVQPLAINMDPPTVKLFEGYLIHFFNKKGLQNSNKGKTAEKGAVPNEKLSADLKAMYKKLELKVRLDEVLRIKELKAKKLEPLDGPLRGDLTSAFEEMAVEPEPNIYADPLPSDESDEDRGEPMLKARAGRNQSRLRSGDPRMNRRESKGKKEELSRARGKRRNFAE